MIKFTNDSGIYVIKNIVNGKSYIGSAVNLDKRIKMHKWQLNKNIHHSSKLQRSYNQHGKQFFIFDLVELVPNKDDLVKIEQRWIDLYDSYHNGYNCHPIARSSLGFKYSDEAKAKMSEVAKNRVFSEETRAKISASSKGHTRNLGKKHTEETRAKLSAAGKNRPLISDETRAKMSVSQKGNKYALGHKHTEESCAKMSVSGKGKTHTEESKAKMSLAKQNMSEETKAKISASARNMSEEKRTKMSEAAKNRPLISEETRAKMSLAQKERRAKAKQEQII